MWVNAGSFPELGGVCCLLKTKQQYHSWTSTGLGGSDCLWGRQNGFGYRFYSIGIFGMLENECFDSCTGTGFIV